MYCYTKTRVTYGTHVTYGTLLTNWPLCHHVNSVTMGKLQEPL